MKICIYDKIGDNYLQICCVDSAKRLLAAARYYSQYYFCGNKVIKYIHDDGTSFEESFVHYAEFQGLPLRIRRKEEDYGQ